MILTPSRSVVALAAPLGFPTEEERLRGLVQVRGDITRVRRELHCPRREHICPAADSMLLEMRLRRCGPRHDQRDVRAVTAAPRARAPGRPAMGDHLSRPLRRPAP